MRARGGQVAIYLAMVLVGICVLVLMNVGVFLSVRAKNRATNAADAAAIAAAKHQGELLNRIGNLNLEHLKSAIENDEERCHEIVLEQMRLNFLGPLDAIAAASRAAMENGAEPSDEMAEIFKEHVSDIRMDFVNNPDLYIPPWDRVTDDVAEGCDWSTYASRLEAAVSGELVAGPENDEFADEINSFPLMAKDFYEAAQGKTWCWFRNYGFAWLLDLNTAEMPSPFRGHSGAHWNSEVYPLHLRFATWTEMGMGFNAAWTNLIVRLTGCSEAEIASSTVITNELQVWAFYDGEWRDWHEISTEHNSRNRNAGFPLIGKIKSEYNVKGCMAQCRVAVAYEDVPDRNGRFPLLRPMSELAGKGGFLAACHYMQAVNGGPGKLLANVTGCAAPIITIIGAGNVGLGAAELAASFGNEVRILDVNMDGMLAAKKTMPPNVQFLFSNRDNLVRCLKESDVLLNAILWPKHRKDHLVNREDLKLMKKGACVIDVACDDHGAIETCRSTTHDDPVYREEGVLHYCVDNIPSAFSQTASTTLANATLPYLLQLADKGFKKAIEENPFLRAGMTCWGGKLTLKETSLKQNREWTDPDELIRNW